MRAELGEYIRRITTVPLPTAPNIPIIDYEVRQRRGLPPLTTFPCPKVSGTQVPGLFFSSG